MMLRTFAFLIAILCSSSQALTLVIWDTEMQTKVGWGRSTGDKFTVSVLPNYNGPVTLVFSQTAKEKESNQFPKLKSRYNGLLQDSKLSIEVAQEEKKNESSGKNTETVTLTKFVQGLKLSLVLVPPSSVLPPAEPVPQTNLPALFALHKSVK